MALYFLSDNHLPFNDDKAGERFRAFLENHLKASDTLILGGDVFDLFVGNKKIFHKQFSVVLDALLSASKRGVKIHYLEGNHDFHLTAVFGDQSNIVVHARGFSVEAEGKKFWIAHGDEIDREDYGYLFLRLITRSLLFRLFLKILPDGILAKIGNWSSRQSRKYNSGDRASNDRTERTKKLFREYAVAQAQHGYDFIFLGHSHLRDRLEIPAVRGRAEYVNLGFSRDSVLFARYMAGGKALDLGSFNV